MTEKARRSGEAHAPKVALNLKGVPPRTKRKKENSLPIRVMFLGLRGFPGVQGGVETHAEHLCPLLVEHGCQVEVIVRSPYQPTVIPEAWRKIKFSRIWAPKSKAFEAIIHTFLGVLYAAVKRPDILHIQAIGPAVMVPMARLLGLRVVVTHHGPDYERQKWGRIARWVLLAGERQGMRWANQRIGISNVICQLVQDKYALNTWLIPNGITLPEMPDSKDILVKFGLVPGNYFLLVSRLVPEKRHLDLINAFIHSPRAGWKLVLVGASDHPDTYTQSVLDDAKNHPGIVCTGFQSGHALKELYAHAGLFVLPSSHEGLPIALLEALSYGLPVLASDIPANLEVGLPTENYFPLSDVAALSAKLSEFALRPLDIERRNARRTWVSERFNWHAIARSTAAVYREVAVG